MRGDTKQVIKMVKDYPYAKMRAERYPKKRPVFMKELQVTMDEYDTTGLVTYNENLWEKIHPDDQAYITQYVSDMYLIFIMEHGIAMIENDITRKIAEDTLLKGKRCKDLEQKYGISGRAISERKREAIQYLSNLI